MLFAAVAHLAGGLSLDTSADVDGAVARLSSGLLIHLQMLMDPWNALLKGLSLGTSADVDGAVGRLAERARP
jgi:hypothetical protein